MNRLEWFLLGIPLTAFAMVAMVGIGGICRAYSPKPHPAPKADPSAIVWMQGVEPGAVISRASMKGRRFRVTDEAFVRDVYQGPGLVTEGQPEDTGEIVTGWRENFPTSRVLVVDLSTGVRHSVPYDEPVLVQRPHK